MKTVIIALACLMLWGCDSPTNPAGSQPVTQSATSTGSAAKGPQIELPDGFTIVWVIGSKDGRYLAVFGVPRNEGGTDAEPGDPILEGGKEPGAGQYGTDSTLFAKGHRLCWQPKPLPKPKPKTLLFDATKNKTTELKVEKGDVADEVLIHITGFSPDGRKLLFSVYDYSRGTTYYVRNMESGRMQSILGP